MSESSDTATRARPAARPKAKPRYRPEPVRPGKTKVKVKAEPTPAATVTAPRQRPELGWLKRPVTIYSALVVTAAVFAGYALATWLSASHNGTADYAKARDAVLLDARQDIVVLNTLDYRKVDDGLKHWLDASTGDLHEQITNVTPADKKDLVTAKKISSGKVIDAAVTQLDNRAGTATVIATVETTVSPSSGTPPKRNRFSATMARDGNSWKLSDLQQVAVNLS